MTFHMESFLDCRILLFFLCKLTMDFSCIFIVVIIDPCEAQEHDLVWEQRLNKEVLKGSKYLNVIMCCYFECNYVLLCLCQTPGMSLM